MDSFVPPLTASFIAAKLTNPLLPPFRSQIEEGLQRLRDVKPAGETYMHEGLKQVCLFCHVLFFSFLTVKLNKT